MELDERFANRRDLITGALGFYFSRFLRQLTRSRSSGDLHSRLLPRRRGGNGGIPSLTP